jgi:carboxypeptidase Taq
MSQLVKDAYAELIRRNKEASLLRSCAEVLGWDEQTYMPLAGSPLRGEQMALLARMAHELATSPVIGDLLSQLETSDLVKEGDTVEAANVREIRRSYNRAVKVPKALVEELARVTIAAQQVWRQARKESNFALFLPYLDRIVALKREEAQAVGKPGEPPYDALLDEYEPGATSADITRVFADLRRELVPLIAAIAGSDKKPPQDILHRDYPVDRQRFFAESAAAAIGFDFRAGRLDVTTHPFCSGFGPGDCRITTRYNPQFFNESFFGVLHEAGHALYEQGLDPAHFGTPAGSYASLGIHESQSRLWENQVGRGEPFWTHFFPRAQQMFPGALASVTRADFIWAINGVEPSFIRVEADEATYNLHIILRFELEQALIGGGLKPADVPGAWNEKFEASFGLKVPDDAHGCLQDVHWSSGGIGYFPTYTLGNLFAAQFMEQAKRDISGLEDDFRRGEFGRLKSWLNEKVHRPGRRYPPGRLCERITGRPLEHAPLVNYLHLKCAALYGLS